MVYMYINIRITSETDPSNYIRNFGHSHRYAVDTLAIYLALNSSGFIKYNAIVFVCKINHILIACILRAL